MKNSIDYKLFIDVEEEFYRHLSDDENTRILFSGKFGIGKSTFLDYFFKNSDKSSQYQVVKINPINYSVLANEDVMTYVKYDILYELSNSNIKVFEKEFISLINSLQVYGQYNALRLLSSLILLIPKFGKQGFQFFQVVNDHYEKFKSIKERAEDEMKLVNEFMNGLESNPYSHYENSATTQMIEKVIDRLSDGKEKILIIDDLDRIDPHHIFRIINVLSANINNKFSGEVKFGFDKIILVCDEINIRNIYRSNFGNNVDYNGYIDKFYSKHVFNFNNRSIIHKYIDNVCSSFSLIGSGNEETKFLHMVTKPARFNIVSLTSELLQRDVVNIRTVNKWIGKKIIFVKRPIPFGNSSNILNLQLSIIVMFDLFIECFGTYDKLYETIDSASKYNLKIQYDAEYILGECGALIDHRKHKFKRNPDPSKIFEVELKHRPLKKLSYTFEMGRSELIPMYYAKMSDESELNWCNHYEIMKEALLVLRDYGYY